MSVNIFKNGRLNPIAGNSDLIERGAVTEDMLYDFISKETYEEEDGTIVQKMSDGRKITTEELENGDIVQKYYTADGTLKWTKTVHEDENGKIIETVEEGDD